MRLTKNYKMYLAFQRAITDLETGIAPDPLKYCDCDYCLDETIHEVLEDLSHNEYRPKRTENFNLPKGEYAIRPGKIIQLVDLAVLHYLLSEFVLKLDAKLPSGVTAYRLKTDKQRQFSIRRDAFYVLPKYKRHKIRIEEPWYNLWPAFRKQLRKDLDSGRYKYVACTDITAYFEDINLFTLGEILKHKVGKQAQSINIITEIYRSWAVRDPANVRQGRGLPQSINISGILANYYLDCVDSYLEQERSGKEKIKWYRYCDDINILCRSENRAKRMLFNIGDRLRNLGLNQNASKTKIYTAEEAIKELFNENVEKISEIIERSQKKKVNKKALIIELRHEYKSVSRTKNHDKHTEATLMRTYTAASVLETPMLINRVANDFIKFPGRVPSICKYARRFINYKKVLFDFTNLLNKKKHVILYHYQFSHLVMVFRNLKKFDKTIFEMLLDLTNNNNSHWYTRIQGINSVFYLGPDFLKKSQVKFLYDRKQHSSIRRSAMILLPLFCTEGECISLLQKYARDLNGAVSRMANYLLELMRDNNLAKNTTKKFFSLNYIFLSDQIWRLWFIASNRDKGVRDSLQILLKKIEEEYRNYPVIRNHVQLINEKSGDA